ncbi:MAG: aspartate aminotransferase [Myxococcota bacterium]|jgi:aspartate aminotransferase
MFENLEALPADSILGLMADFRADPRPNKIDLGVGVYKDANGATPVLAAVKAAEARRLQQEDTKSYIGPAGNEGFNNHMARLMLGEDLSGVAAERISVVQTPGGCGALRAAAEFVLRGNKEATIWVSDPTWANHVPLLGDAGLTIREYPYFDAATSSVRFDAMIDCLKERGPGELVLLHGCCHNPCGADLSPDQWDVVLDLAQKQGFTPFIDLAYQGFGEGVDADALGVRLLAAGLDELIVASSCSKNFGLYRERTGAVMLVARNAAQASAAKSQLLNVIRGIYSMPPAHGGAIVDIILSDPELTQSWQEELATMRGRINELRELLVSRFKEKGAGDRFDFIGRQRGMFSFLGISAQQVAKLRDEHAIYMVNSSRINVAGASQANIDHLCESVISVL